MEITQITNNSHIRDLLQRQGRQIHNTGDQTVVNEDHVMIEDIAKPIDSGVSELLDEASVENTDDKEEDDTNRIEKSKVEEAKQRIEIQDIYSTIFAEMISKAEGKTEEELRAMMNRGEILTNMWSDIFSSLRQQPSDTTILREERIIDRIKVIKSKIDELSKEQKALENQLHIAQQQKVNVASPEVLKVTETLARVEKSRDLTLARLLSKEKENTLLSIEETGYFFNATNMAHISRLLFSPSDDENNLEAEGRSLKDTEICIEESIPLVDRLEIKYNIDMVKHNQFPPYEEHCLKCHVCRNSVAELLEEYEVPYNSEEVARTNLSTRALLYLPTSNFSDLNSTNHRSFRLQAANGISQMLKNHLSNVKENMEETTCSK